MSISALRPLSILVVEDTPANRIFARVLLQSLGHEVDFAETGEAAIEAVQARRYDLVLMDVHMPGISGLEATARIRAELPAADQPRIYALTGSGADTNRRSCLDAGMDGFLAKPMQRHEVMQVLDLVAVTASSPSDARSAADADAASAPHAPARLRNDAATPARNTDLAEEIAAMSKSMGAARAADMLATHIDWARALFDRPGALDASRIGGIAHALRSSSRMFGFHRLADRCDEVDEAVLAHRPIDVTREEAALRQLLEESLGQLGREVSRLRDDAL
jgi:CheY-like chemotaxis protein/HPt (histidine-containing phosphotransfer) domain-containing protein